MTSTVSLGVIIPIYQSAATIRRALESVAHASRSESPVAVEVIVVFDGPDSESQLIVDEVSGQSSLQIQQVMAEFGGVGSARNHGIAACSADFVTFLDADDEMTKQRVRLVLREDAGLVIGRQTVVFDVPGKAPAGIWENQSLPNHYFTSVVAPTLVVRELGGFRTDLALGADVDMVIRARDEGFSVTMVDDITTIRHVDGRNASLDTAGARRDMLTSLVSRNVSLRARWKPFAEKA